MAEKMFVTLKDAEAMFGIGSSKLKMMAAAGTIPATKAPGGKKWLIDVEAMKDVLRNYQHHSL